MRGRLAGVRARAPDVLALQEVTDEILQGHLRAALEGEGLGYALHAGLPPTLGARLSRRLSPALTCLPLSETSPELGWLPAARRRVPLLAAARKLLASGAR